MLRLALFGGAVPLGLATGLAAWLVAGGASANFETLDGLETKVRGLRAPRTSIHRVSYGGANDLLASPIFAMTTGADALREPSIRLDGVSISSRRTAALVSVDGKFSEWMRVGEARDGVTLQALSASGATFETPLGSKQLALGEQSAASAPLQAAAAPPQGASPIVSDEMPPGFRSPPPPASAPPA